MTISRAVIMNLAWIGVVPLLFRAFGPRLGALVSVFAGFLFVPRLEDSDLGLWILDPDKISTTGLGLLLGVVIFDRGTLRRFRPHWFDLPMLAFVFMPVLSAVVGDVKNPVYAATHAAGERLTGWALIYFIGRLYFGHVEGTRLIAKAVVVGGLVYIPFCLFEIVMGRHWYLAGLLYGQGAHANVSYRLGGWRPTVFLRHGIELTSWMALSVVTAAWLWMSRSGVKIWRLPTWLPPLALVVTTVACHGVYSYVTMAVGLVVAAIMILFRTRLPLVALLVLNLAYMGVRATRTWDGHQLVELAALTGRPDTIEYRLRAEDTYLTKATQHNLIFGFVGPEWGIYDFWAKAHLYLDAWWMLNIMTEGLAGLAAFLVSFFLLPAGLMLARLPSPSWKLPRAAPAWGLVIFLCLHMADTLQNRTYLMPTVLMGGALVSLEIGARKIGQAPAVAAGWVVPVLVAAVLLAFELVARLPETPPPAGTPPLAGEVDGPPRLPRFGLRAQGPGR